MNDYNTLIRAVEQLRAEEGGIKNIYVRNGEGSKGVLFAIDVSPGDESVGVFVPPSQKFALWSAIFGGVKTGETNSEVVAFLRGSSSRKEIPDEVYMDFETRRPKTFEESLKIVANHANQNGWYFTVRAWDGSSDMPIRKYLSRFSRGHDHLSERMNTFRRVLSPGQP